MVGRLTEKEEKKEQKKRKEKTTSIRPFESSF